MDWRREVVGGALCAWSVLGLRGRLISHAPQLGRMVMALSCPGLRGTLSRPADARQWASCRSEPGMLSARTLRGSDSGSPVAEEKPDGSEAIALPPDGGRREWSETMRLCVSPRHGARSSLWWGDGDGDGERDQWVVRCHEGIGVVCDGVVAVGGAADDDNVELYFVWDVAGADVGLCCPGEVADFLVSIASSGSKSELVRVFTSMKTMREWCMATISISFCRFVRWFRRLHSLWMRDIRGRCFRPIVRCRCVWPL